MTDRLTRYPDISDILARKTAGRVHNASLSFTEKLTVLDALKERTSPFVKARKAREAKQVGFQHDTSSK
jgi:hypothetical protein